MFSFLQVDDPGAPGVGVAFTDRYHGASVGPYGALNLGRTDVDDPEHVLANFAAVRKATGVGPIVVAHQVHGAAVLDVDARFVEHWGERSVLGDREGGPALLQADAMVTALRGATPVALCIRVADCVPVLFADPAAGVVGAAHAGREGFARGVLPATVEAMQRYGATRIQAWIGPHICGACYEVPADMQERIAAAHPAARATTSWGTPALDLGGACAAQLDALGVASRRVDPCTREDDSLHSHRRDGAGAGRLAGLIWLLPPPATP